MANRDASFIVTARDLNGRTQAHRITAASPREAAVLVRAKLRNYPIRILSVEEVRA